MSFNRWFLVGLMASVFIFGLIGALCFHDPMSLVYSGSAMIAVASMYGITQQ